jgi:hypothetical protein
MNSNQSDSEGGGSQNQGRAPGKRVRIGRAVRGRNQQLGRLLAVMRKIAGARAGLSVCEMQALLEDAGFPVAKRTLYRDIEALELSGFPLVETGQDERGGVRFAFMGDQAALLLKRLDGSGGRS